MKVELTELRERLSAHGLTRRRWPSKKTPIVDRHEHARLLRGFAEQSGPVFVAFVRDLSARLDLLPLSDCMILAETEDRSPETPYERIAARIGESLGSSVEEVFAIFDREPIRKSLFTQWHAAVTIEGEDVMVEIVRPDTASRIESRIDQLHVLSSMHLPHEDWSRLDFRRLIEEFRTDLHNLLDLAEQGLALESLASAIVDDDALIVAEPVDRLCSRHVLTVRRIEGRFVDSLEVDDTPSHDTDPDHSDEPDEHAPEPDDDVGRQLCLAWMQQALFGECYPAHAQAEHFMLCDDGRLAVLGGGISHLTSRAGDGMLDYLSAASRQDPDLAAVLLTREMERSAEASRESLRLAFRQAEPFRDGGWIPDYAGPRLAHDLFVHWRLAGRCGFEPLPHLRSFFRGLAELERTSRQMAPSRDALQQGLNDVRVIGAAVNLRRFVGPTHLVSNLERLLPASQELLHRLNEIALDINEGRVHPGELPRERRKESSGRDFELLVALLLVMAAVALVTPRIASLVSSTVWIEPLGVTIFLAMAGMLFWQIGKRVER